MKKLKTQKFTIYLFKKTASEKDVLSSSFGKSYEDGFDIKIHEKCTGKLFVKTFKDKRPKWTKLFEGIDNSPTKELFNASNHGTLILKGEDRIFAIAFGAGRFMLNLQEIEERFGLIVCLNSIDSSQIKSIDKQLMENVNWQSRIQSGIASDISDFDIDADNDLLKSITGKAFIEGLGALLSGNDGLSISIKIDLDKIPELCAKVLERYLSDDYKKTYNWIDNISEIKNKELIEKLNKILIANLKQKGSKIWMAIPEIIDWSEVWGFAFSQKKSREMKSDIIIEDFIAKHGGLDNVEISHFEKSKIFALNEDAETIKGWPAIKCLYGEITYNDIAYILNSGKWYNVSATFVDELSNFVDSFRKCECNLPDCNGLKENDYNKKVAKSQGHCLMDGKLINYGGSHSSIEFCDLYTLQKEVIHVKKYGGSSVLSHLFNQGLVSGELFKLERDFRKRTNELLDERHRLSNADAEIVAPDYTVVFAIISKYGLGLELPLFSKVALRHAVKILQGFGYNVCLEKVNYINRT